MLKESIAFIQRQGKLPVLDLQANAPLAQRLCEKLGFEEVPSADPGVAPTIYVR